MRVLHVIQSMARGGAERVLVSIVRGALTAGHEVALAAAPGPLATEVSGPAFPMPMLGRCPHRVPAGVAALDRALRAWRPDLVHAHNPGMALVTALATLRGRRVRALVSVQGVAPGDYAGATRVLRLAGLPVAACGRQVATALGAHGVQARAVIENAVSPPPPPSNRAAVLRELSLPPDLRLVVSVGRLVPQKDHEAAVGALADVPDAALVILGEGPSRASIEARAREAGVSDRVRLPGSRADARAIAASADAVVAVSRWEGLPLAVLEAMAAGRAVVATRVIGLGELIEDDCSGLLVSQGDTKALAAALRRVLDQPVLAARLGKGAVAAAARYSEPRMVAAYLDLYADLLGEGK